MTTSAAVRSTSRPAASGFALVSVLWTVSTLALIAASIATAGALSYAMSRNAWAAIEAELAIEAALNRAVLGLLDQRLEHRWRVDGVAEEFVFEGRRLAVSVQDELGKIDLNAADGSLLESLFVAAGLPERDAAMLAERALDWRSPHDAQRLGGAFQTTDELGLVPGVTPELLAVLEPAITVHSQRPGFDAQVAPRLVLMTLDGIDAARAERIVEQRRAAEPGPGDLGGAPLDRGRIPPGVSLSGRSFAVHIDVADAGASVSREIVVQLTGDTRRPYWVRAWR